MIIIPNRLKSSRFPNKILCDILGLPMIIRCALIAKEIDEVVLACEDDEVIDVAKKYNLKAIKTSNLHTSGTDRCAEAVKKLGLKQDEIIINMQGDEPFLESSLLRQIKNLMEQKRPFMASLAKVISPDMAKDPNLVKVVLDINNYAIYFSRSVIPYARDGIDSEIFQKYGVLGHLGVYGFSVSSLEEFCHLEKSPLEDIEKLEQLRALYHQKSIAMAIVESQSIGIDTIEDLNLAIQNFTNINH